MPSIDFVQDDCTLGSAVLGKSGCNISSTQSILPFHVKVEKSFFELTESVAMGFSMVCVMLQAVYTTAEKEFRTIVYLIFYVWCWHKKKLPYVTKDETTWYFIQFIIKAKVYKVEVCFKHSVEAYVFK